MMKSTFAAILLMCISVSHIKADNAHYDKMSTLVRKAAGSMAIEKMPSAEAKERQICVFIRIDPAEADAVLTENGCRTYDSRGDIFIASVPVGNLAALSSSKAVSRIEAGSPCRLTMDTTAVIVNALPVYSGTSLPQAYTGKGVVVGVMDVGFDLTHPNFYAPTVSDYRIKAFWDQLSTDTVGSRFPVGRDYVGRDAILQKQHSADGLIQTHGTHTLGIAAGSGYDTKYRGMAYESDICLVSNAVSSDLPLIDPDDVYKYTSATDALGFKYLFDYAAERNMPCVASFSEGSVAEFGVEDSLYCEYLGRLTGPGRIIVASAGNESVRNNYIPKPRGTAQAGSFLESTSRQAGFFIQSDAPFKLRLLSYGNAKTDTLTISSADCSTDTTTIFTTRLADGRYACTASIDRYHSSFSPTDTIFHVKLSCDASFNSAGPLAIVVEGREAEVSVRNYSPAMFTNGKADGKWSAAEMSHNIHVPACFPGIIAVGSTIHRTGYVNYQGKYLDYSQPGRNDGVRSEYSSIGPSTDGRTKPDVMAPGDNVVSSYSSYYEENNPEASDIQSDVAHFLFNGRIYAWNANTGTSMAAPVVAGAIALWLQAKPDLTPDEALQIFSRTCRRPEHTLTYPNNYYGHGEINAYKGLLDILGVDGIKDVSAHNPKCVSICPLPDGNLRLAFTERPKHPFNIRIYSVSGTLLYNRTFPPSTASDTSSMTITVPQLAGGVYAVQITGNDKGITGSTLIRK